MKLPVFTKEPEFIKATFRINTPMFVAGASKTEAEFTPTAFKGVLRFWWRALNWSKIFLANNKNKTLALQVLHKQEAELFGLASKDNKGGQGDCLVNAFCFDSEKKWQLPANKNGVGYLLGQGLFHFKDGLTRRAFADNQTFSIDLTVTKNSKDDIIDTLKLIGLLGSFGSRSRHGFGSVTLTKLQTKQLSDDNYTDIALNQNAKDAVQALLTKYDCRKNTELPPLSAFYSGTRIDIIAFRQNNAIDVLNAIGEEQQLYRSWGRNGRVNGKNAERNFADDHNFVLNLVDNKTNPITHPKRVVFGLPHNYFYSGNDTRGYSGNIDASTGRRASPLLLHIHRTNNGYQAIHCLFKSEFLPNGATVDIVAKKDRNRQNLNVSEQTDYQIIETFMNRFNGERV